MPLNAAVVSAGVSAGVSVGLIVAGAVTALGVATGCYRGVKAERSGAIYDQVEQRGKGSCCDALPTPGDFCLVPLPGCGSGGGGDDCAAAACCCACAAMVCVGTLSVAAAVGTTIGHAAGVGAAKLCCPFQNARSGAERDALLDVNNFPHSVSGAGKD